MKLATVAHGSWPGSCAMKDCEPLALRGSGRAFVQAVDLLRLDVASWATARRRSAPYRSAHRHTGNSSDLLPRKGRLGLVEGLLASVGAGRARSGSGRCFGAPRLNAIRRTRSASEEGWVVRQAATSASVTRYGVRAASRASFAAGRSRSGRAVSGSDGHPVPCQIQRRVRELLFRGGGQAARRYSLITPPTTRRRWTGASMATTVAGSWSGGC